MNLGRLDPRAVEALALAHQAAAVAGHDRVMPEDLLVGLLRLGPGELAQGLRHQGVDVEGLYRALGAAPEPASVRTPALPLRDISRELEGVLAKAWEMAVAQQRRGAGAAQLFQALLFELADLPLGQRLAAAGIKVEELKKAAASIPPAAGEPQGGAKAARNLQRFGRCLTDLARAGLLDPTIGREQEVRRVMQVLCRRVKNNPVLIGRPGVGKRSIVHGLAQQIAKGDVPAALKNAAIYSLDLGALAAGGDFRGAAEERLKRALDDVRESAGEVILFVEELHSVVRGGASDLAGILKPALAHGEVRCVGVATLDDYRNHIEKDTALERRFQPILVKEPSVEESLAILRGLRPHYEAFHDLRITDAALQAAAQLSHRFIAERSLPDKAIDLVDEAAAKARIERDTATIDAQPAGAVAPGVPHEPAGQDAAGRDSALLGAGVWEAFGGDGQEAAPERRRWQAEQAAGQQVLALRELVEWRRALLAHGPRTGWDGQDLQGAGHALAETERRLLKAEARLEGLQGGRRRFRLDVEAEDIAQVVAAWTGIPLTKLLEDERLKLLHMEGALHQRVVGQDQAVRAVSNAVRLARAGMKDPNRPVGSFLFLGPTGVGKTELSRALAEFLFDDEAAMVRIDMSEYMDKHTVSRLVGAPPGYIGYEDSGQLTEAVRRRPYSVVLFDEIDKAHPDVFNILLQVMDEGRLSDGHGRLVDFKNTILIMTSNVGGHLYRESLGKPKARLAKGLQEALRSHFRPEFLNRIDAIVQFDSLKLEQIAQIVEIQLRLANRRLSAGGIRIAASDEAKAYLAREGFDPLQGARPLKRLIQQQVLEPLALRVLKGEYRERDVVSLALRRGRGGGVLFKRLSPAQAEADSSSGRGSDGARPRRAPVPAPRQPAAATTPS